MVKRILSAIFALFFFASFAKADAANECQAYSDSKNYQRAIASCTAAAQQGDDSAQTNLGMMYADGLGVSQDFHEAMNWFRAAAAQGNELAQILIAYQYEKGQGVAVNNVSALMWYNIAEYNIRVHKKNDKLVKVLRKGILSKMTYEEIAEAQTRAQQCLDSNFTHC